MLVEIFDGHISSAERPRRRHRHRSRDQHKKQNSFPIKPPSIHIIHDVLSDDEVICHTDEGTRHAFYYDEDDPIHLSPQMAVKQRSQRVSVQSISSSTGSNKHRPPPRHRFNNFALSEHRQEARERRRRDSRSGKQHKLKRRSVSSLYSTGSMSSLGSMQRLKLTHTLSVSPTISPSAHVVDDAAVRPKCIAEDEENYMTMNEFSRLKRKHIKPGHGAVVSPVFRGGAVHVFRGGA